MFKSVLAVSLHARVTPQVAAIVVVLLSVLRSQIYEKSPYSGEEGKSTMMGPSSSVKEKN